MKIYLTVSIIGFLQGVLLSAYFFQKSKKSKTFLYLALYVLIFSLGLLEEWVSKNGNGFISKLCATFIGSSSFLYGPLLYLFIAGVVYRRPGFQFKHLYHFSPFLIIFFCDLILLVGGWSMDTNIREVVELIIFELFMLQLISYNIAAIKLLKDHDKNILQHYSNLEGKELKWLQALLIAITLVYIVSFGLTHLLLFGVETAGSFFVIIQFLITGLIYFMSYMVLFRPDIFNLTLVENTNIGIQENNGELIGSKQKENQNSEKYKKSGLKKDKAEKHLFELREMMQNEKLYKNSDLNISILSEKLGISKNHLTQVLNELEGMTFFEFINMYRTEEAKKLLLNPEFSHLSIAGISNEVGYKSKSSFFTNFKKNTGSSPLEWLKKEKGLLSQVQS